MPTGHDAACFEAGIEFGSLYRQFVGTPVSLAGADSLARAMEAAIENRHACESVTVGIDRAALTEVAAGHGYTESTGRLPTVEIEVEHDGHAVDARMAVEDGYPLLWVTDVGTV
ncbi:hypothetical protein BRD17_05375 [Halobacteriales archaeon SW_7_68_16]|nr:MAG: hypothetical protein BRD17_05375 [Halobacteriales archaeon SW_7_68_16]